MPKSINTLSFVRELYGIDKMAKDVRVGDFVATYNNKAVESKEFANVLLNRGLQGDVDSIFVKKTMPGFFTIDGKFSKMAVEAISTWRHVLGLKPKATLADMVKAVTDSAKSL